MPDCFAVGQLVCLKADPSRSGPIIAVVSAPGGQMRYRVFHSPTDIREYLADQVEPVAFTPTGDRLTDAVTKGEWLSAEAFRARLTAARLADPQIDHLYSLYAGRIQYIPFQFKPLLRFLRADQPRLLIADEVGVGKTIEAGIILKELQARQRVDNILILCPKALVTKWRDEMRRFDEDFRPLSSESLRYCLDETDMDGAWPGQYSRAIVHLELLRQEQYLNGIRTKTFPKPGLTTLTPPPHFTLLIVDEAHHLRNPGTLSHQLARILCNISDAVLFLSATPVHVGSENLYNLLNLLRPDLFSNREVFNQVVEPNQFLTGAMRALRSRQPQSAALQAMHKAAATAWGGMVTARDPLFSHWQTRLQKEEPLSDLERVRCVRDLEELHSLAHVINRTRRRDIGRFTLREPLTVTVPFTEAQSKFYEALMEFRRQTLLETHNAAVVSLITDTLQRQAASCLPALAALLDAFLSTGRFVAQKYSDDPELEETSVELSGEMRDQADELRQMARALPDEDPKFDQLLKVVQDTSRSAGPGKVLVFSYFLHTLDYLYRKLYLLGYRVAVVNGGVIDEDREMLRNRFRLPRHDPDAIDILLSSEVGCEGLDYEFCDRLVNYDIPWNPMRIEQRIGRIDRFGQAAEKVLIFNFITPGTVEERIFFRCFDRLGIFRDTIGDLEEVLGDLVEDLNKIALDPQLSAQQADEKARQMSDNLLRQIEEDHRLEEESGGLLGVDQIFTEDISKMTGEGRFVAPDELRLMVELYVEQPAMGGKLTRDEKNPALYNLRLRKESRQAVLQKLQSMLRPDRSSLALIRWLQGDETFIRLTFDQNTALENRSLPFITPVHPLARLASAYWQEQSEPLVTHIQVTDSDLPAGRYLFLCELWDFLGVRSEVRMISLCWDIDRQVVAEEISQKLLPLLFKAGNGALEPVDQSFVMDALQRLEEAIQKHRETVLRQHRERNLYLLDRRIAGLKTWYQGRLAQLAAELETMRDERIRRMKESEKNRLEQEQQSRMAELDQKKNADITTRRIALGILEVENDK